MLYNLFVRFVKHYWAPLIAIVLIPMLCTLAIWQVTWIRDMGERERFRLAQSLYAAAGQLGAAFQNEIGILPAVFGVNGANIGEAIETGNWDNFKERWEVWKAYSLDSSIVSGFHILNNGVDEASSKLWTWNGFTFAQSGDINFMRSLKKTIQEKVPTTGVEDPVEIEGGGEAYIIPLSLEDRFWMVISMDREVLTQKLIPLLAERYLYGKNDYYFRIVDQETNTVIYKSEQDIPGSAFAQMDLNYPLLRSNLGPRNGGPGVGMDMPPVTPNSSAPALGILKTRRDVFSAQLDPDRTNDAMFMPKPPQNDDERNKNARWVLEAVHRAGSLAAAVRVATVRSTAISLGILAMLAGALVVLSNAVRRTQQLADRQREFIATVTHELKTPVAVIRSAADNLADGVVRDAERTARYGNTIRAESGRLGDMIDSLLVYSRVGDGSPRETAPVDLNELASHVVDMYRPELAAARFKVELSGKDDIIVLGDDSALELALGNLIANTLKHARSGTFLGVRVYTETKEERHQRKKREWAVLEVSDHGPGVPRRERHLVFEAFYRGEQARTSQLPGSGLGLNLVSRIVAAHGGSIQLETQGDLGSTFIIRLPREVGYAG